MDSVAASGVPCTQDVNFSPDVLTLAGPQTVNRLARDVVPECLGVLADGISVDGRSRPAPGILHVIANLEIRVRLLGARARAGLTAIMLVLATGGALLAQPTPHVSVADQSALGALMLVASEAVR